MPSIPVAGVLDATLSGRLGGGRSLVWVPEASVTPQGDLSPGKYVLIRTQVAGVVGAWQPALVEVLSVHARVFLDGRNELIGPRSDDSQAVYISQLAASSLLSKQQRNEGRIEEITNVEFYDGAGWARSSLPPASIVTLLEIDPCSPSQHTRVWPEHEWGFMSELLRGAVVLPGALLGVDWYGRPSHFVVRGVECTAPRSGEKPHDDSVVEPPAKMARIGIETTVRMLQQPEGPRGKFEYSPPRAPLPEVGAWVETICENLSEAVRAPATALVRWIHAPLACARPRAGRGLLLTGPSGAGKTTLVHELVRASRGALRALTLHAHEVFQPRVGGGEAALVRRLTTEALAAAPCIVLLDGVETIAAARRRRTSQSSTTSALEDRLCGLLLATLDRLRDAAASGVEGWDGVFVLGVSSRPHAIDSALLLPGRLGRHVDLGPLSECARLQLLRHLLYLPSIPHAHSRAERVNMIAVDAPRLPLAPQSIAAAAAAKQDDEALCAWVARRGRGLVAAEVVALVREAQIARRRRWREDGGIDAVSGGAQCGAQLLHRSDFREALERVQPASLKAAALGTLQPKAAEGFGLDSGEAGLSGDGSGAGGANRRAEERRAFAGIGGLDAAKAALRTLLLLPLRRPQLLTALGTSPPRGVLLHGASGNGKTLLAEAVGRVLEAEGLANFVVVRCAGLVSKVVGQSERAIANIFQRARRAAPCVLLLEQLAAIAPRRGHDSSTESTFDRILSCLLLELDGVVHKQAKAV